MANLQKIANNVTRKITLHIYDSGFVQTGSSSLLNKIALTRSMLIGSITFTARENPKALK